MVDQDKKQIIKKSNIKNKNKILEEIKSKFKDKNIIK